MKSKLNDKLLDFLAKMENSTSYIKKELLKDGYSYKIYARNAYVGIWIKDENYFLISRYKVGKNPNIFREYHWDADEYLGTAKPIELIEKAPFDLEGNYINNDEILKYLDNLEINHPLIKGINTVEERKLGAKIFKQRLSGMKI
jgi:hypothetical protein